MCADTDGNNEHKMRARVAAAIKSPLKNKFYTTTCMMAVNFTKNQIKEMLINKQNAPLKDNKHDIFPSSDM